LTHQKVTSFTITYHFTNHSTSHLLIFTSVYFFINFSLSFTLFLSLTHHFTTHSTLHLLNFQFYLFFYSFHSLSLSLSKQPHKNPSTLHELNPLLSLSLSLSPFSFLSISHLSIWVEIGLWGHNFRMTMSNRLDFLGLLWW